MVVILITWYLPPVDVLTAKIAAAPSNGMIDFTIAM